MQLQFETAGTDRKTKLTVTVIWHSLQQWYNPHHVLHLTNVEGIFLSKARQDYIRKRFRLDDWICQEISALSG